MAAAWVVLSIFCTACGAEHGPSLGPEVVTLGELGDVQMAKVSLGEVAAARGRATQGNAPANAQTAATDAFVSQLEKACHTALEKAQSYATSAAASYTNQALDTLLAKLPPDERAVPKATKRSLHPPSTRQAD